MGRSVPAENGFTAEVGWPEDPSTMNHSPGFLALVQDAQTRIQESTIDGLRERLKANPSLILLDVREESEWAAGHAVQASHLGKGILERDLEARYPDKSAEIVMYCGGGYRSALTCDAAQKMGYQNVRSLIGGYKGLLTAGWPMTR
jgi:rhodanese-related sulfurtransferase